MGNAVSCRGMSAIFIYVSVNESYIHIDTCTYTGENIAMCVLECETFILNKYKSLSHRDC